MNRRGFLGRLLAGVVGVAIAPKLLAEEPELDVREDLEQMGEAGVLHDCAPGLCYEDIKYLPYHQSDGGWEGIQRAQYPVIRSEPVGLKMKVKW